MPDPIDPLPPPMLLAIAHARPDVRSRLGWLLQLDQRLLGVADRAGEALMAQMRLAWWRDAFAKPAKDRPKGEPLLAQLPELGDDAALLLAAGQLVDAAESRLTGLTAQAAEERALALVGAYAAWVAVDYGVAKSLGQAWVSGGKAALTSFPRILRPMTILAMAEILEAEQGNARSGLRLSWHALTGR